LIEKREGDGIMAQGDIHTTGPDSWGEWRRHVLLEMESQRECIEKQGETLSAIKTEIALLKYKSSIWGAVGAGLVVLIYVLIEVVKK
jgi:hypothetical protein